MINFLNSQISSHDITNMHPEGLDVGGKKQVSFAGDICNVLI